MLDARGVASCDKFTKGLIVGPGVSPFYFIDPGGVQGLLEFLYFRFGEAGIIREVNRPNIFHFV